MSAADHTWKPLGFAGTLRFFLTGDRKVASWRHFGWELEVEREPLAVALFKQETRA